MSTLLIDNIGSLVTNDASLGRGRLGLLTDAALLLRDGKVAWYGPRGQAPDADGRRVDAEGGTVLPGFVDSHAHLVFAGDRTTEFSHRMSGKPYTAGGIGITVRATRSASDEMLRANLAKLVLEARGSGTTTIECKSGYGLTVADELRSLSLAREVTDEVTFLGAHVVPPGYDSDEYVALVAGPMMRSCAPQAKWVDVFCDRGAFDADQTREILRAGVSSGLVPRLHANQLEAGPGVQIAVEFDAASADHVTHLSDADVDALAGSRTVATLLPGAEFSTRSPWPDARRLLDAGVTVALATDCNPGSSFTTSMPFCIALAVRDMGMTPDEAVWSATAGGAQALRRNDIGHLAVGATADVILLDAPSPVHLAYRPGVALVTRVWLHTDTEGTP